MADKFSLKAIITAVDKLTPTLKGIQRISKVTHKSIRDIGSAGGELMGKIGLPAGIAFGAVALAAQRATNAVLDYGGAVADAAAQTGMAVGPLQSLRLAGEQAGVTAEQVDDAMIRLNKSLAEAAAGKSKSLVELLGRLGVPKGMTDLNKALPLIAEGIRRNEDPALRTRILMELLGRSGAKLAPIFAGGAKGLERLNAETERLGASLGQRSIDVLDSFGDSIGLIGRQILVQFGESLAKVLPVIEPMLTRFSEWIAANKELIQQNVARVIGQIAQSIERIDWERVARDLRDVGASIGKVIDWMGGMKGVAIALGIAFLAGPLAALVSLGAAFVRLGGIVVTVAKSIAVAFMMNPVLLAFTALILIIATSAWYVWKNWKPIKAFFLDLWASVSAAFSTAWTAIGNTFTSIKDGIVQGFWEIVGTYLSVIRKVASIVPAFLGGDTLRAQIDGALAVANEGAGRSSLTQAGQQRLNGEMVVRFEGAPPGTRVEPGKTNQPGVRLSPDVGYRSAALGMA